MDRVRIEDISAKFSSKVGLASTDELIEFAEHIAKLARSEALEDAAKICDKYGVDVDNDWNRSLGVAEDLKDVADDCADQIRALKEKS